MLAIVGGEELYSESRLIPTVAFRKDQLTPLALGKEQKVVLNLYIFGCHLSGSANVKYLEYNDCIRLHLHEGKILA
jgi:hypothetical protein